MKIVLFAPSGAVASAVQRLGSDPAVDDLTIVSCSAIDSPSGAHNIVLRPSLSALTLRAERMLGGSVVGRNALRLSVLDRGRRFASAARRSPEVRNRIADAELIVALERDGILAAWQSARHGARDDTAAVYGIAPAESLLRASRD